MSQVPPTASRRRGSDSGASECSVGSVHSASTAPTIFSTRPALRHWDTDISEFLAERKAQQIDIEDSACSDYLSGDDSASVLTYASTTPSEADLDDAEYPVYDASQDDEYEDVEPVAYPSTPSEFAAYFPSTRRLCIRHDDTIDGNMNLRVDTEVPTEDGQFIDLTLFHLRMHDLKHREFSLRRYCRNSGREVCHSRRKLAKPATERRPSLSRSVGSALASLRSKNAHPKVRPETALKRIDSGYDSMSDEDIASNVESTPGYPTANTASPTNVMSIEFSNYAHVDLKRRGASGSKRYDFEYWGHSYTWHRSSGKSNDGYGVSYHLYDAESPTPVAHIVPNPMTSAELDEEESRGGWIPPSSMWISDMESFGGRADAADVIIATGLLSLVDDCIKQRWHRSDRFQFPVSIPSLARKGMEMEYIGPKRLIEEVFNRRGSRSIPRSS